MRFSARASALALAAVVALPPAAHAQQGEIDTLAAVGGIVSAAATGAPLPFARVSGGGRHDITDDAGRIRLCGITPGIVAIVTVAPMHDTAVVEVTLAPGEVVEVNPVLREAPRGGGSILLGPHRYGGAHRVERPPPAFFLDGERGVNRRECVRETAGRRTGGNGSAGRH